MCECEIEWASNIKYEPAKKCLCHALISRYKIRIQLFNIQWKIEYKNYNNGINEKNYYIVCLCKRNECVGIFNFQVLELTFWMGFLAHRKHTAQFVELICPPKLNRSRMYIFCFTLFFLVFPSRFPLLYRNVFHILTLFVSNLVDFLLIFNHRINRYISTKNFTNSIMPMFL